MHFWSISLFLDRFTSRVTVPMERLIRAVKRYANLSRKREMLQKCVFWLKKKKFHKNKVDSFEKLSTRACLFYDFLHFKGCPYLNHKISWQDELIQQNRIHRQSQQRFIVSKTSSNSQEVDIYRFFIFKWIVPRT